MNAHEEAPGCNGGSVRNLRGRSYATAPPNATRPGNWLNPRRRLYAERLIEYVAWHAGKVYLNAVAYLDIRDDTGLDRYAVDLAADDLYRLGAIDLHLAGDTPVLTLLSADLDAAATGPQGGRR